MTTPVITYPEVVFKKKWPGWAAFLGAKNGEDKAKKRIGKNGGKTKEQS